MKFVSFLLKNFSAGETVETDNGVNTLCGVHGAAPRRPAPPHPTHNIYKHHMRQQTVNLPYQEMFLECCWMNMENAQVQDTNYKVQNKYKNRRSKHFPQLISIWVEAIESWKYWSISGGAAGEEEPPGERCLAPRHTHTHATGELRSSFFFFCIFCGKGFAHYHNSIFWQKAQQCLRNHKVNCTTNDFH